MVMITLHSTNRLFSAREPGGKAPPHKDSHAICREVGEEVRRSTRLYLLVGLVLFCGTIATAAVATIPALDIGEHGFDKWDALLGLLIASFKASLVAAVFMHLNHERKFVYVFITLAAIHAVGFFVGTYWHYGNFTHDRFFYGEYRPDSERRP
jgi:cytochrome c oxidase subunit IV